MALRAKTDNRSQGRSNVFLSASLVAGSAAVPVRVRNLSARGALLDGAGPLPPAGTCVRLVRGELAAEGGIAWLTNGHAGIRFTHEINVGAWVRRTGQSDQQRNRTALPLGRAAAVAGERRSGRTIGEISEELAGICERLAGLPSMAVRMGGDLARLETLAAALKEIAEHR